MHYLILFKALNYTYFPKLLRKDINTNNEIKIFPINDNNILYDEETSDKKLSLIQSTDNSC